MAQWRRMQSTDIPQVMALADQLHPGLPERAEVFAERQKLYPEGCLVLERDGEILGYGVSHPVPPESPPQLDTFLGSIPPEATDYYIHDVALSPKLRGSGLARVGIEMLLEQASRYRQAVLISVYGTGPFWARFGFIPSSANLDGKLSAYGDDAVYMVRAA